MFFNAEIAAELQYFTFPLEVLGLALATIEVRYPVLTSRIASWLSRAARPYEDYETVRTQLWSPVSSAWNENRYLAATMNWWRWFFLFYTRRSFFGGLLLYFFVTLGFILLLFAVGVVLAQSLQMPLLIKTLLWSPAWGLVWGLGFPLYAMINAITTASAFAERFVEGRAVGTIGIFIAGLGVAGEAYQFMTQVFVT